MKKSFSSVLLLAVALSLSAAIGCSKPGTAPQPLPLEQFPTAMGNAFKNSSQDVKDAAGGVVSLVQSNDLPTAYTQLHDLNSRPDLTPEQRALDARAMMTVSQTMQDAAAKGDEKSAEFLRRYRSSR